MILHKLKTFLSTCLVAIPFMGIVYNLFCIQYEMARIENLEYYPDMISTQLNSKEDKMNEYAHKTIGIDSLYEFRFGYMIGQNILRNKYEIVFDIIHHNAENILIDTLLSSSEFIRFFMNMPNLVQEYIESAERPILSFSFRFRNKTGLRKSIQSIPMQINADGKMTVFEKCYEIVPINPNTESR